MNELVAKNMQNGTLRFDTKPDGSIGKSDAVFIAVGTPARRGDGHADLSYVFAAAQQIAKLMTRYTPKSMSWPRTSKGKSRYLSTCDN